MTVSIVENCPSFTTNIKVAKRRILDEQSKIVLNNRNARLRVVMEPFFARFLKREISVFLYSKKDN